MKDNSLEKEICKLETYFPDSSFNMSSDGSNEITATLFINKCHNDFRVFEYFKVLIILPMEYPFAVPDIVDIENVIDRTYSHLYEDGRLCIGVPTEILINFSGKVDLIGLVDSYIVPYFFSYKYYMRFDEYPFGERSHGAKGILETYMDLFGYTNTNDTLRTLYFLVHNQYKGHKLCHCESGLVTRKCHPVPTKLLHLLDNPIIIQQMKYDLFIILKELKTNE